MKRIHRLFYPSAWSITVKVLAALLALALIPMSLNSFYNLHQGLKNAEELEQQKLELLATREASRLERLILDAQQIVVQVSQESDASAFLSTNNIQGQKVIQSNLQGFLGNTTHSSLIYDAVYLIDPNGECVASTDESFIGNNYGFHEYFRQAMKGKIYISNFLNENTNQRSAIYLANPVRASTGKIIGVAVMKIREEFITKTFNRLNLDPKSYAFLIDQIGIVTSHPNKSLLHHSLGNSSRKTQKQVKFDQHYNRDQIASLDLKKFAKDIAGTTKSGYLSYKSSSEKQRQRVGFATLAIKPWILGINLSETDFTAPLRYLMWQNCLNLLVVGAIASILSIVLAHSITKPIKELSVMAEAIEQDSFEFDRLLKLANNQNDIGRLVRIFIHMAHRVKAKEQRLKQKVVQLNFEIDEVKRERQVAAVTGTEYFQQLQQKAQRLRNRSPVGRNIEAEYYQQIKQQALRMKQSTISN
ncbi:cache and HAMP domain-containing protein [Pleurocapsa sp. PCC 7319]|uniref:PDC sensor domain-containing protein n=1 Tax=Pleurocapsa sp. PCC 7319 TaxID=118161 RepID=UPI00034AEF8B|nr:cache and HAMP domain-containing protein [Pleurocapsa sp. PCC 7319]